MVALSECSTNESSSGAPPTSTTPYMGYMSPMRGITEKIPQPHEVCVCGKRFHPDGLYCLHCGTPKPTVGLAEMVSAFEELQAGVAKGVFEDMKRALEHAAVAAVENLNGSMARVAGKQSAAGSVFAQLRAAQLGGVAFSGHCGFHTNEQAICHLLHLVVQMAIFPRQPLVAHHAGQAGAPFSAHMSSPSQTEAQAAEAATQTTQADPPRRNTSTGSGPLCGVRIGGGYHLVQTLNDESGPNARELPGTVTSPGRGRTPLQDVASATLLRSSSESPSPPPPRRGSGEPSPPPADPDPSGQNAYGFGARSGGTPSERFRVASFVPGVHEREQVLPDQAIRKHRTGEGVSLSRFLSVGRPKSGGDGKPRRPMSARTGKERRTREAGGGGGGGGWVGAATTGGVPKASQAFDDL